MNFDENTDMKTLLQLEEIGQLILAIAVLYLQPLEFSWLLWLLFFFAPDISMVGYVINTKIGVLTYNIGHHKLTAVIVIIIGYVLVRTDIQLVGYVLFAHSCFDRVFGYGLKYSDSFKHTHLGSL